MPGMIIIYHHHGFLILHISFQTNRFIGRRNCAKNEKRFSQKRPMNMWNTFHCCLEAILDHLDLSIYTNHRSSKKQLVFLVNLVMVNHGQCWGHDTNITTANQHWLHSEAISYDWHWPSWTTKWALIWAPDREPCRVSPPAFGCAA